MNNCRSILQNLLSIANYDGSKITSNKSKFKKSILEKTELSDVTIYVKNGEPTVFLIDLNSLVGTQASVPRSINDLTHHLINSLWKKTKIPNLMKNLFTWSRSKNLKTNSMLVRKIIECL